MRFSEIEAENKKTKSELAQAKN